MKIGTENVPLDISEIVIEELEGWAIEDARRRVRYHFEELRAVLAEQEKTAMAHVETETRGRLCALRQQQKDLTTTRSQVAGVCIQCESILDSEDWKLLSSSEKVKEVLATLEQQQQHYAQLGPDFLSPESSIPIIFSRVRKNILCDRLYGTNCTTRHFSFFLGDDMDFVYNSVTG